MTRNELGPVEPSDFEAIIFDCDGTLADTMPAHYVAWLKVTTQYGLRLDEDRFYSLGGRPSDKILEMLAEEQGIQIDAAAVAIEKEKAFIESMDMVEPIRPVTDVVHQYRGKIPLAVATGAMRWVMDRTLIQIGLEGMFDASVTAEDTYRHKPFPDVFLEAARLLGVEPSKCCVYEDADLGVEAAHQAGMRVIDVRDFHQPRRVTAADGSLLAIPGA
ncbi:MAG: HAD-IA family hydrolase [Pirellulaceae bacterium]